MSGKCCSGKPGNCGITQLFENNRIWSEQIKREDPDFLMNLSKRQHPEHLWIGCSDSRVVPTEMVGLHPGDLFVHRNIANVVIPEDLNFLAVLQYAVEALKVKHVIVCGHYGCGGIKAAMEDDNHGEFIDKWLQNIRDVYLNNKKQLDAIEDPDTRFAMMCELNVVRQVSNICSTGIIQSAWEKGQELSVHGWIYSMRHGQLKSMDVCITKTEDLDKLERRLTISAF